MAVCDSERGQPNDAEVVVLPRLESRYRCLFYLLIGVEPSWPRVIRYVLLLSILEVAKPVANLTILRSKAVSARS